jgi:ParB-like chromosome segregation protein Spo0J
MPARMKNHPIADLFPMMAEEELQDLAADIAERGLLQPITRHDGVILDGRS